ncbi:MAG: Fe-S oxidoreductase [Chromatiales bacterium]|nr:Fe-S oxidoreductase [Chromatiales bacterium]
MLPANESAKTVALFATCLVDLFQPEVGFAAVRLLEAAGFDVRVPDQGCCGQPNFNGGDQDGARQIAAGLIRQFAGYDYVVAPSGSCAAMVRCHYPVLFADDQELERSAVELAQKTWELTSFLVDVAGYDIGSAALDASVTYHDSCSGLRELGIREQPRQLLSSVAGIELREMEQPDACCGFGGLFCVKYPDVADRIGSVKTDSICAVGADYVAAGDVGCLMQIEGKLHRLGEKKIKVVHVAEILAKALLNVSRKDSPGSVDADD